MLLQLCMALPITHLLISHENDSFLCAAPTESKRDNYSMCRFTVCLFLLSLAGANEPCVSIHLCTVFRLW